MNTQSFSLFGWQYKPPFFAVDNNTTSSVSSTRILNIFKLKEPEGVSG